MEIAKRAIKILVKRAMKNSRKGNKNISQTGYEK
jgi:hypothetical protein